MLEVAITFVVGFIVKWIFEKISIIKVSKTLVDRLPQLKILTEDLQKSIEDEKISEEEAQKLARDIINVVLNK